MLSDTAPFYAGSTITDPRYFVGYREQLDTITTRTVAVQPTSINVVGKKRTGKSSLLYHFYKTYKERVENPRNYLVVYLSLEQGNCQRKSSFYRVIAEKLCQKLEKRFNRFRQPRQLIQALQANNFDTDSFYDAIVQFRDADILPIICLDKIEVLFKHPEEFNDNFYNNLRSLMDRNAWMLVIASEKELKIYSRRQNLTSSFFNVGQVIMLEGFTDNEARDLVRLPQSNIPSSQSVLDEKEQQTALEWGGRNPYLLQLAGLYLWDAKRSNNDINWAKKNFALQARGISANHSIWRRCLLLLKWVFWHLPIKLGQVGRLVGTNLGDIGDAIVGWGLIGLIIFVVFQKVPLESFLNAILNAVGLGD